MKRLALGILVLTPTAGIPRPVSGAADLAAPAPRTADGRPDLSGHWIPAPSNSLPCRQGLVACGIEWPMSREGATWAPVSRAVCRASPGWRRR